MIDVGNSLAIALTSYSMDRGTPFPKVTLPDFEVRASKARQLTNSDAVAWYPLVADAERQDWEAYSAIAGPKWLRTTLDQSGMEDAEIPPFPTKIHDGTGMAVSGPLLSGDETLSGKYAVAW